LWGSAGEAAQRASRAFARAQGLAGEDAIQVPAAVGGRLLSEEMQLVPWRAERPARREGPWPGSLPRPVPATVFREPPSVGLRDAEGGPVVVTARGLLSAPPAELQVGAPGAPGLDRVGLRAGRCARCWPTAPPPCSTSGGGPPAATAPPACSWWCAPPVPM